MNAIAEKLAAAGVDTVGARFTSACVQAIRHHPNSIVDAWREVGALFGHEFLRGIMKDMRGPEVTVLTAQDHEAFIRAVDATEPTEELKNLARMGPGVIDSLSPEELQALGTISEGPPQEIGVKSLPKPYTPRVIPKERLEKRRELQQIVRSKYKNSSGIAWSDVSWHELHLLQRDGEEAKALLEACASEVPNDGRTVGDVLGIKRVDEIIAGVRGKA